MSLRYSQPIRYRPPFPQDVLIDTLGITWFSAVGIADSKPPALTFTLNRVPSVAAAVASITSESWADFRLERRNDLTKHLAVCMRNRDSEWNKCAVAFRDYFDRELDAVLGAAFKHQGLPDSILAAVAWDIISYWQEINYRDVRRPGFFTSLFELYRRGHLPCGWEGSDIQTGADATILYR